MTACPRAFATGYLITSRPTTAPYFWSRTLDHGLDSDALAREVFHAHSITFKEDKVALESIEELIARDDRPEFREQIVSTNHSSKQMMRMIARVVDEENRAVRLSSAQEAVRVPAGRLPGGERAAWSRQPAPPAAGNLIGLSKDHRSN
jgi:hypothetical protein